MAIQERDPLAEVDELIDVHGGEVTLRVTDLLAIFGHYNLRGRDDIAARLQAHGVAVDPPLQGVERHYFVRLAHAGEEASSPAPQVTRWRLGADGGVTPATGALGEGDVLWIDVEAEGRPPDDVDDLLGEALGATALEPDDRERLRQHLMSRDYRPAIHVYDAHATVRTLSCFAVAHDEETAEDPTDPEAPKTGRVTFWPLEMASGPGFLITVRHSGERIAAHARAHTRDDMGQVQRCAVLAGHELQAELAKRWRRSAGSAGDAALHLLHWVVDDYVDALHALESWLRQWELQALEPHLGPQEKITLTTLRDMLAEIESRIAYFAHPHGDDPVTGWVPGVTDATEARHVLGMLRRNIRQIERLEERVRDRIAAVSAQEDERRSQRVETVGFILLFPALITGIFGANTRTPGAGTWTGFVAMLLTMVALTYLSYALVLRQRRRRALRAQRRTPAPRPGGG